MPGVLAWAGVAGVCTALLWLLRGSLDQAHMALAYLLVVLGASARQGRAAGLTLAVLGFLGFNFFLLPPFYTFKIADPLDWLVLAAFLTTSSVAAELLHRAQREARIAERRTLELDRLSSLGAESLSVARAEDAVQAIARVIRSELPVTSCEVVLREAEPHGFRRLAAAAPEDAGADAFGEPEELFAAVVERGVPALVGTDGTARFAAMRHDLAEALRRLSGARVLLIPLRVRERTVGVLKLSDRWVISLDASQARFAGALAYYAALAVERTRLAAEAERVEALREADRLKDALLASVSHDLRTPLTTIRALATEIRGGGDERAATIEVEADRLNRVVADLLDISRLRAGALPIEPEITAAEDVLGAALQRVSGHPGANQIKTSIDASEPLLVGRFDFVHTLRAVVNLVENALRHSPAEGSVEIRVERRAEEVAFLVADRGPGVPATERERIFEPFYRRSDGTAERGGTGLGLAIARSLAEAQGGGVDCDARAGGGSVFTLRLPAADVTTLEKVFTTS